MSETQSQAADELISGSLRSTITLELHTHRAIRIWQGRKRDPEKGKSAIISMSRLMSILNAIKIDSSRDNPYADIFMLILEERLVSAKQEMNELILNSEQIFKQLPKTLNVEECLSVEPVTLPIYASSQLSFMAIYLLTAFDELARKLHQAHHIAIIDKDHVRLTLFQASNLIRSILNIAQKYRRIPLTRQDVLDQNARALAAEKLFGPVPINIMDGSNRSRFSSGLITTELVADEDETQHDEEVQDNAE